MLSLQAPALALPDFDQPSISILLKNKKWPWGAESDEGTHLPLFFIFPNNWVHPCLWVLAATFLLTQEASRPPLVNLSSPLTGSKTNSHTEALLLYFPVTPNSFISLFERMPGW